MAAVAAAGGAFAQSTLTGELSYGFSSETAANSTLSGFGLEAADITIATTEDIEGLGKVAAAMNFDASGGRGSNATVNDVTLSLTMTSGMKITGGSTLGGNYLSQGLASAGSAYELNMSNKIFSKRTANDFVSVSMPLMEGTKLTYTRNEGAGDVTIGSGSASALGTSTQSNDTISLDYAAGALAVNVQARNYNQQIASSTSSAQTRSRAAASYDLGVAKIGAGVENTNYTYGNTKSDSVFGLTIPMGAANIGGQVVSSVTSGGTSNYSRSGALFGGTYNLSKRTYAVAQYYSYDAGSTVSNTSGYILALYNTF